MTRVMRAMKLPDWPEQDRAAWERACQPAKWFAEQGGEAAKLRAATKSIYVHAYGRWLAHLAVSGTLAAEQTPTARITPAAVTSWVEALQRDGLQTSTIHLAVMSLHSMAKLLDPRWKGQWLIRPSGRNLGKFFPAFPRIVAPQPLGPLMRKVRALHEEGRAGPPTAPKNRLALRDAAFMGLLLTHAPRIGDVAGMRLGLHLTIDESGTVTVFFPAGTTKGRKDIRYPLAPEAAELIRDYIVHARAAWPGADATDHLWMGFFGKPLGVDGASQIFSRRTRDWLGTAYGPHAARHWLRDNAASVSPQAAADVAVIMGHHPSTALKHYALASDRHAVLRHAKRIAKLRKQLAPDDHG